MPRLRSKCKTGSDTTALIARRRSVGGSDPLNLAARLDHSRTGSQTSSAGELPSVDHFDHLLDSALQPPTRQCRVDHRLSNGLALLQVLLYHSQAGLLIE